MSIEASGPPGFVSQRLISDRNETIIEYVFETADYARRFFHNIASAIIAPTRYWVQQSERACRISGLTPITKSIFRGWTHLEAADFNERVKAFFAPLEKQFSAIKI